MPLHNKVYFIFNSKSPKYMMISFKYELICVIKISTYSFIASFCYKSEKSNGVYEMVAGCS